MRIVLKVFSIVLMLLGVLFIIGGVNDIGRTASSSIDMLAGIATILLSGLLFMACEISGQLAQMLRGAPVVSNGDGMMHNSRPEERLPEEGVTKVLGTRAGAAAIAAIGVLMIIVVVASVFFKR
jgi:hypothetical protein